MVLVYVEFNVMKIFGTETLKLKVCLKLRFHKNGKQPWKDALPVEVPSHSSSSIRPSQSLSIPSGMVPDVTLHG